MIFFYPSDLVIVLFIVICVYLRWFLKFLLFFNFILLDFVFPIKFDLYFFIAVFFLEFVLD
jgi:hypothetical protein